MKLSLCNSQLGGSIPNILKDLTRVHRALFKANMPPLEEGKLKGFEIELQQNQFFKAIRLLTRPVKLCTGSGRHVLSSNRALIAASECPSWAEAVLEAERLAGR